jgi:hypothetical protein
VRCDGRDQAVATVAAATIQPRRAARAAPLRAAAVGGAARMWADTHRRPVRQAASTSYSPQNRPRPPSARPQRPLDLSINRHVGFCHFLSIVVGFVKMGKVRSTVCENATEK